MWETDNIIFFRTGLLVTHVDLGGNLVPAGTVLVTPVLDNIASKISYS